MDAVGVMAMPPDFRYRDVFARGKPRHDGYDDFRIRHPGMPAGRRAKIFAPFDALRGFSEAVASKDVVYLEKTQLDIEAKEELGRRLNILHNLTYNGRMARANRPRVTVTFWEPCADEYSEFYGIKGLYATVTGICMNVEPGEEGTVLVDGRRIPAEHIVSLESPDGIFDREYEGGDE